MAIENYNVDWNGRTGAEVQSFIKQKLQSNESVANTARNESIVGLTAGYKNAGTEQEDRTTIEIVATKGDGNTIKTEFQTITESDYVQHINEKYDSDSANYRVKSIIAKDTNLLIPYDYYVEKEGIKISGLHANVTFTISNNMGTKTFTTTTYTSSKSSTVRSENFTIPSEYLGIGNNTIQMRAITVTGSSQTSAYEAVFETYVADLKLDVTIPDFQELRDSNQDFTMSFSVRDTNNAAIPSGKSYKVNAYISRISAGTLIGQGFTVNQITANFTSLLNQTTQYSSTTPGPEVSLIFQAVMLDDDNNEIISNTVLINMLNRTAINNEGAALYSAVKLNNIQMQNSNIYINVSQYETVDFDIFLYAKGSEQPYNIVLNTETKASGLIAADLASPTELLYSYIFRGTGTFAFSVASLYLSINVAALNTSLSEPSNAALDLNASEKAVGTSDDEWTDAYNNSCTFQGFDWVSNGWVRTSEGTALLLNNGANLTIDYKVCDNNAYAIENYPFTVSIKYKIKNGFNLAENIISCANATTGFIVRPSYVELKTSNVISQNISNDDVHEVTFVYYGNANSSGIYKGLQAIYIDGKIQAITNSGAFVPHTNNIVISGEQANVYIYSVKAYRRALSFTEIQSIYCFNQTDSNKIASYVKQNNIFSEDTVNINNYSQAIDMNKLPDGSPILVLYGDELDPTCFKTINGYAKNEDNKKAIHKLHAIKFYIKGQNSPRNFYMLGGGLGAQGTSSMAYPVKNFRVYTNKDPKNVSYPEGTTSKVTAMWQGTAENPLPWNFDPESPLYSEQQLHDWERSKFGKAFAYSLRSTEYGDSVTSAPSNRFCLKADYAESSGSHNVGLARFANDVMKNSTTVTSGNYTSSNESTKLPQQIAVDKANPEWPYDVRSNIDGFPIYLFFIAPAHEENGVQVAEQTYFCGRYNMNNDKSNVHVFGFESIEDYFENPIVAAEGRVLQQMAISIDPNYAQTHCAAADADFINPTECWEFSSNDGISRLIGSFNTNWQTAFTMTTGSPDEEVPTIANGLAWLNGTWEARYPDISGAVKAGEDYELPYRDGRSKPYLLYQTYKFLNENNYALHPTLQALNSFADNLHLYFNVNSVVKYFLLTHWFCAADQRIKNSMLSFYCDPYGVSADEAAASPLHYMRAYYIFYDNDTILGLNNSGAIKQPWDFYETDEGLADGSESKYATEAYTAFPGNGIHGIWTNLQKCYELYRDNRNTTSSAYALGKLINDAYISIRTAGSDSAIENYFERDQCNQYPDAVHNVDLELKYLNPNITSTNNVTVPCNLDMAQGTRQFHRKNWLKRRTLWLDDLYGANIEDYCIRYKTFPSNGLDNGTIKLQSDPSFRFWRFFQSQHQGQINRKTGFLTPSDVGTITLEPNAAGNLSQSDYFILSGLYGCKSIDFSDYNFDNEHGGMGTCDAGSAGLPFPYLQTFIMKKYEDNTYVQCSDSGTIFSWITPKMLPNLKQLHFCHVRPVSGTNFFGEYKLRDDEGNEFTNLEVLDLRDTPISNITLPNSSSLTSLSLDNPIILKISNKPNITNINIGSLNLDQLTVDTSSSTVYTWALNAAIARYGQVQKLNISFGTGANNPYVIDSTNINQLTLLNNLAQAYLLNPSNSLSVTGHIYTTEDYDISDISEAFPNLNISSTLVTDGFSFGSVGDLYEDSVVATMVDNVASNLSDLRCLEVRANMPVVSWAIAVDGDTSNNLNGRIKIVKSQAQKCWIHADPYTQNSKIGGQDHTLTVYATLADNTTYNTFELNGSDPTIYYNPISTLNITAEAEYTTDSTTLNFNFGEHTKAHLLTSSYVASNPSSFTISGTNSANVALQFNADNVLSGATVALVGQDSEITVSILGNTKTYTVYYDSNLVANLGTIDVTSPLYWMKKLVTAAEQEHSIGNSIKKSDAAAIQILNNHTYWNTMLGGLATDEVSVAQDFSDLKYFQLGATTDGLFTIPAVAFTNLSTPKGTTSVTWTNVANDTTGHAIIKLGNTVKKLCVSVTFSSNIPEDLQFDLSDTQITKIGAYGNQINAIANYTASVQITANSGSVSSTRPTSLFIYPNTITEIGNFDKTASDLVGASPATLMFNLTNSESMIGMNSSTAYAILTLLNGFDSASRVKLGAIASYRSKGSGITSWAKVLEVEKAFVYYNNINVIDGVFTLPNVQIVGDQSFYTDQTFTANADVTFTKLYLNGSVTKFGDEAFARTKFSIHNASNSSADRATFSNVTEIGNKAFFQTEVSQTLEFGNRLSKVGAQAFETTNTGVTLNIKINRTAALDQVQVSSFGSANSNTTVLVPAGSDLYTQLTASDMQCKNHVQTF